MATKGPERTVSNSDIRAAVEHIIAKNGSPIATTPEIAAEVGASGETIRQRAHELTDVHCKKIGGSGPYVYWLSD